MAHEQRGIWLPKEDCEALDRVIRDRIATPEAVRANPRVQEAYLGPVQAQAHGEDA